jgi:threonine/homoserine/homoserine lactone efflux protein
MIDPWLLFKSISAGIAVAAPVGPMSLLCMQRTLGGGRATGLAFGAGIATADFTFACLGAFGLTAVSSLLLAGGGWLRLAGALVLLYFAVHILRAKPETTFRKKFDGPRWRGFASAYLLTLANPPTILFFAGLFASITALSNFEQAAVFALGIFTGSMLWWLALTSIVAGSAAKLAPNVLVWINRLSGLVLIGFAVYALSTVNLRGLL